MPTITFNSEADRKAHPIGNLVNPYLAEHFFKNSLTELEQSALQEKSVSFSKEQVDSLSLKERERLLLCLLLNQKSLSIRQLIDANDELFGFENDKLAELSAMTGRLDIIGDMGKEGVKLNLIGALANHKVLLSASSMSSADNFVRLLEFPVLTTLKVRDFLITADYKYIYQNACRNGYLDVIRNLEAIDGFDKVVANEEYVYEAYRNACQNGHHDVIRHLESIDGFDKLKASSANNYEAYCLACQNGRLDVIRHLEAINGFDALKASKARSYEAYRYACQNGHLDVIKHLEAINGFDALKASKARSYEAYRHACQNGYFDVIKHLESSSDFDALKASSANDYTAYRHACLNGHLDVIKHFEAINGFDALKASSVYKYTAYSLACQSGHLDIIKHLESSSDFDALEASSANDYAAYRHACLNGHLDVIKHLEAISGFDRLKASQAFMCAAYSYACQSGHLDIIKYLEAINGFDALKASSDNEYAAYRYACASRHFDVIKHLESISGFDALKASQTHIYTAYRHACKNGDLDVIKHFEAISDFNRLSANEAYRYEAYCNACENGHHDVLRHLEAIDGFDKVEASKASDYYAYRYACENGQLDIIKHLLAMPSCFSYAESHDREYGEAHIYDWVSLKLRELDARKMAYESGGGAGVFDISNEDAHFYSLIIRNLIRRGVNRDYAAAENTNDAILSLLEIPSIKAMCHQRLSENGVDNELLRFAVDIGNQRAVSTLLTIPAVSELAAQNNFYQNERQQGVDLRRLAQDRESSMTALTDGERHRLGQVVKKYGPIQQKMGIEKAFDDLKSTLEGKYNENPAIIMSTTGNKISLPCKWSDFNTLGLTDQDKESALKSYYKNETHTALRYLSRPNYWIAQNSSWVNVNPNNHNERWSTFEEYKQLISLMYLAAIDESSPPTQGHTVDSRIEHFIRELALIGRAHNWDKTRERIRVDGSVIREEFDDLEADHPSCFSGVKRRLFQSLVGHADFDVLTIDVIEQELQSFYRQEVKALLSHPQFTTDRLQSILADFYRVSSGGDCDYEQFLLLNVAEDKKSEFKKILEKKYGKALTEFMFILSEKLKVSSQGDFLSFSTSYDLLSIINQELESRSDNAANRIKNAQSMDEVISYAKCAPTLEGKENLQSRAFDIMMLPGLFRTMVDKLSSQQLAQVFQIGNEATAHHLHQLLQLEQEDFDLLLSKLDKQDIIKLFLSANEDGIAFISSAFIEVDLRKPLIDKALSDEEVKSELLSDKGLESILNVNEHNNSELATEMEANFSSGAGFFSTSVTESDTLLKVKLHHALKREGVQLTAEDIRAIKNKRALQAPILVIAELKGIDIDELYSSISDNKPPMPFNGV